jgi:ADP-glucose pyrophosphorylase
MSNSIINENTSIQRAIVGEEVTVDKNTIIGDGNTITVISEGEKIL